MSKARADMALAWLERNGSKAGLAAMARYNIPSEHAFGVPMNRIQKLAKELGRDHELALALWETGRYEARLLAAYVDDPAKVTSAQMDKWRRGFDNWGVVDTICFALFDRTPHAWAKVAQWSRKKGEFEKRAAFALLWSLALHDKRASDEKFVEGLALIERAAEDDRNFVKKAVSMALKAIGKRNASLEKAAGAVAARLAESPHASARWIGTDALKELGLALPQAPKRRRKP